MLFPRFVQSDLNQDFSVETVVVLEAAAMVLHLLVSVGGHLQVCLYCFGLGTGVAVEDFGKGGVLSHFASQSLYRNTYSSIVN